MFFIIFVINHSLFFCINNEEYNFYEFFTQEQAIKLYPQVENLSRLLEEVFPNIKDINKVNSRLEDFQNNNIFNLRKDKEVVASVFIIFKKYHSLANSSLEMIAKDSEIGTINVLEIYSFVIDKNYRGRGISGPFLSMAIESIKHRLNLNDETIVGLHLDTSDKLMNFAFALYVRYGFNMACICKRGPSDLRFYAEKIFRLNHPIELANQIIENKVPGRFIAMYTRIKDFRTTKSPFKMKHLIKVGETLRQTLIGCN